MSSTYSAAAEIAAINFMLSAIGEAPVNQLGEAFEDARIAQTILEETSAEVQGRGWSFNSEDNYPLHPDVNGEVVLPANTLKVDFGTGRYVQRGRRVYDKEAHTTRIYTELKPNIVLNLPYSDLPIAARTYIKILAARRFQAHMVGSTTLNNFLKEEAEAAWVELVNAEAETGNHTLYDNPEFNLRTSRGVTDFNAILNNAFIGGNR